MSGYKVRAVKWSDGWELHIEGEGATQVRTLDKAAEQVRDYLGTIYGRDCSEVIVEVIPDLGALTDEVAKAREAVKSAAAAQEAAARMSRAAAKHLRESGLSVTDSAAVLGVSRGRVSQLTGT